MFKVKVPATTANIGPGFDSLGIALRLYNTIEIQEISKGLVIEATGRDAKLIETNEGNLVYKSIMKALEKVSYSPTGLHIKQHNEIPISRGLGSSAACIVGGLLAGNLLAGNKLSQQEVLELAVELEGHPDNVAPALLGGMVVSVKGSEATEYIKIPIKDTLEFYAAIPDFEMSTKMAREALPQSISLKDAAFNIGRAALLVSAFATGDYEKITIGLEDRLHQPYRLPLLKPLKEIFQEAADKRLKNIFLSGAGPTIIYLSWREDKTEVEEFKKIVARRPEAWCVQRLMVHDE